MDVSPYQEFVFVSCLPYGDPQHNPELRSHVGTHPEILKKLVDCMKPSQVRPFHEHVTRWMADGRQKRPTDMCVVFVCKSENHRSVGARWLYHGWIKNHWKRYVPEGEELEFLATERNGHRRCGNCEECSHQCSEMRDIVYDCVWKYSLLIVQCERERDKGWNVGKTYSLPLHPTTVNPTTTEDEEKILKVRKQ